MQLNRNKFLEAFCLLNIMKKGQNESENSIYVLTFYHSHMLKYCLKEFTTCFIISNIFNS